MRMKRLLRAITLITPPMSYDLVKKSLHNQVMDRIKLMKYNNMEMTNIYKYKTSNIYPLFKLGHSIEFLTRTPSSGSYHN